MAFLDDYKINKKVQSKVRTLKSKKLREKGNKLMEELALTEKDIQNIFDILEEDLPEL
jgi:molybdenum-dependent DNA-binding transcriptional regulator ModE